MESTVKEIVARFLKKEPSAISAETIIDRSSLGNSIMVHRLYAALADKGVTVRDYSRIRTYGELQASLNGTQPADYSAASNAARSENTPAKAGRDGLAVGIDLEEKNKFPEVADFRSDSFYTSNFNPAEISYCSLQSSPLLSFAGLFAAKEAIVKADNNYRSFLFKDIEILHDVEGKPFHPSFHISISHTDTMAVAVAVPHLNADSGSANMASNHAITEVDVLDKQPIDSRNTSARWLAIIAILISLTSLILMLSGTHF